MSPNVPTPSKGALRALRTLAFGTTCTVAFSTAVIAEDARRRLRSAQKIRENGRKIKESKRYRSSGPSAAQTIEDAIVRYGYSAPDPHEDVPRAAIKWSETPPVVDEEELEGLRTASHSRKLHCKDVSTDGEDVGRRGQEYMGAEDATLTSQTDLESAQLQSLVATHSRSKATLSLVLVASGSPRYPAETPTLDKKIPSREKKPPGWWGRTIAATIEDGLDVDDIQSVRLAAEKFLRIIPRDWTRKSLGRPLVDSTVKLSNACVHHQLMDTAADVIQVFCESGHMTEENFVAFHPEIVLEYITSSPDFGTRESKDGQLFQKAKEIFCVRLKEKPKLLHPRMPLIGKRLCDVAFLAEDYFLFDKIYWQTQGWSPGNTVIRLEKLMLAHQKTKHHNKVVQYFHRYAITASSDMTAFVESALIAVESAELLGDVAKGEAILQVAADTSAENEHLLPVSLLLKVLGGQWRLTRDFTKLQALFERLEKYVNRVINPVSLYSHMIQLCVEADCLRDIQQYVDKSTLHNGSILNLTDMRTRCSLALAKGAAGDWAGAEDDLRGMKEIFHITSRRVKHRKAVQSSCFTQILKLFVKSHDVTQTEEFLQRCIDEYGVLLNQYMSNIMVGVYVEAGELDSVPAWLKYAQSRGLLVNATTFNIMLQGLTRKWGSLQKLIVLVERVKESNASFVNDVTLRILGTTTIEVNTKAERKQTRFRLMPKIERKGDDLNLPHDSHTVKYAMNCAMDQRNFAETLRIYRLARKRCIHLDVSILDRALEAVRQIGGAGATDEVADLLADAQSDGKKITHLLPQFIVGQLRNSNMKGNDVDRVVQEGQAKLNQRGMALPLHAVTEAVTILVRRGNFRQAIDLWLSFSSIYTLDLHILNVLLQAYVKLYDCVGMRWVVRSLITGNIRSDAKFRKILKDAAKTVAKQIEAAPHLQYLQTVRAVLQECLRDIHEHSVIPGDRAKKEAEDKVTEIMMLAGAEASAREAAEKLNRSNGKPVTETKARTLGVDDWETSAYGEEL